MAKRKIAVDENHPRLKELIEEHGRENIVINRPNTMKSVCIVRNKKGHVVFDQNHPIAKKLKKAKEDRVEIDGKKEKYAVRTGKLGIGNVPEEIPAEEWIK